jgi:DNA modification methylase
MGRYRQYLSNASRQLAYRTRKAALEQRLSAITEVTIGDCTLYCGDARDVLPTLSDLHVLVTDPPYGVLKAPDAHGRATKGTGGKHGLVRGAYASYDDSYENFCHTIVPILEMSVARARRGAVFTGEHIKEQPKATITGGVYCPAGVGRNKWGFTTLLKVLFYGQQPQLAQGARLGTTITSTATAEKNGHPCPKPIEWMRWLVDLCSLPEETVFDPFMGSGTTGVACVEKGRPFVGIELDAGYFQIACERIAGATSQGQLFTPTQAATQGQLFAAG